MQTHQDDKLISILKYFSLKARVFQNGPLCHTASFDANLGLGYIHVLQSGDLSIETPGHPVTLLEEPSLFFYMNPTSHRLKPVDDQVEMVCASFDFGTGLNNPLAIALPDMQIVKLAQTPSLNSTLQLLFNEAQTHRAGQQAMLDRLMEVVIIQLLRELIDKQHLKTGLLAGLAEPRLAKAITAIHDQPGHPWTLHNLAEVAGMSRARFASRFHEVVGTTAGNYLSAWRIGVAQSLLRRGKSMPLIADAVGYANASALSRAFSAQVGVSPAKWKKLNSIV